MGGACDGFNFLLLFLSNLSGSASEILCANCWEVKVSRKNFRGSACPRKRQKHWDFAGLFPSSNFSFEVCHFLSRSLLTRHLRTSSVSRISSGVYHLPFFARNSLPCCKQILTIDIFYSALIYTTPSD